MILALEAEQANAFMDAVAESVRCYVVAMEEATEAQECLAATQALILTLGDVVSALQEATEEVEVH